MRGKIHFHQNIKMADNFVSKHFANECLLYRTFHQWQLFVVGQRTKRLLTQLIELKQDKSMKKRSFRRLQLNANVNRSIKQLCGKIQRLKVQDFHSFMKNFQNDTSFVHETATLIYSIKIAQQKLYAKYFSIWRKNVRQITKV